MKNMFTFVFVKQPKHIYEGPNRRKLATTLTG